MTVYADGSCLGNPGRGGWAWAVWIGRDIVYESGFEVENDEPGMELKAATRRSRPRRAR